MNPPTVRGTFNTTSYYYSTIKLWKTRNLYINIFRLVINIECESYVCHKGMASIRPLGWRKFVRRDGVKYRRRITCRFGPCGTFTSIAQSDVAEDTVSPSSRAIFERFSSQYFITIFPKEFQRTATLIQTCLTANRVIM